MAEERYCENCRAEIPPKAKACPACGVFVGDLFDGRILRRRTGRGKWVVVFVLILAATAAAGWLVLHRRAEPTSLTTPVPVVSDRPGGTRIAPGASINEAEAIRILRRHLVESGIANDCIAISSQGADGTRYRLTAVNRCAGTRLGRYVVDGNTGQLTR